MSNLFARVKIEGPCLKILSRGRKPARNYFPEAEFAHSKNTKRKSMFLQDVLQKHAFFHEFRLFQFYQ